MFNGLSWKQSIFIVTLHEKVYSKIFKDDKPRICDTNSQGSIYGPGNCLRQYQGFPGSSAGKESACNSGDSSSIPRSGRSHGEGISYPLQYSWASLVTQMVKTLPAMQETWFWSLDWEDPLEKGTATHSSILAWRIPWTKEPGTLQSMGLQRVRHDWVTFTFTVLPRWR